ERRAMNQAKINSEARLLSRRLGVSENKAKAFLASSLRRLLDAEGRTQPLPAPSPPISHPDDYPKGYLRIPFSSKSDKGQPLSRALAFAAVNSGSTDPF